MNPTSAPVRSIRHHDDPRGLPSMAAGQTAKDEAPSQLNTSLIALDEQITEINERISRLEKRLTPVLVPTDPRKEAAEAVDDSSLCPLVQILFARARDLRNCARRLFELESQLPF